MFRYSLAFSLTHFIVPLLRAQSPQDIQKATLAEVNPKTAEVSTEELRKILADSSAAVFDVRPRMEFAVSHVPGALNVAQKPGSSKAFYVSDAAEIGRLLGGHKSKPMVLYCNGPFCGKSKRLAEELLSAGYSNVRHYQLGIPVWRALGGVTQMEADGARYVKQGDTTAVWLDTRVAEQFEKGSLPGAKRIGIEVTQGGKDNPAMQRAKNDGTLPVEDHNTRVIVFGDEPELVRAVADSLAKEAFHNVAYFAGTHAELAKAVKQLGQGEAKHGNTGAGRWPGSRRPARRVLRNLATAKSVPYTVSGLDDQERR